MTSFIITAHANRTSAPSWKHSPDDPDCPFCRIIRREVSGYVVYENDFVIAILDILPLRPGHTLVIPKKHCPRVSELPTEYARAVGEAVTKVSAGLTKALENTALNVVCNQEYAQAVHHVHYHIIPAPQFDVPAASTNKGPTTKKEMHYAEFEARTVLDEDEGEQMRKLIAARM